MSDWYKNGELPPLNSKVIFNNFKVEVLFHAKQQTVIQYADGSQDFVYHENLKPIQSLQEQEREEFIKEVQEIMGCKEDWNIQAVSETAHAMFKAGYRKVRPLNINEFVKHKLDSATTEELFRSLKEDGYIVESKDD